MVLTGSAGVLEPEYRTRQQQQQQPLLVARKIEIRQPAAASFGSRLGSRRLSSSVTRMQAEASVSGGPGGRMPLHPKLRKILVESQGVEEPGGGRLGATTGSRSRNSPTAAGGPTRSSGGDGGAPLQAAAAAVAAGRKKPATRARAKDVLSSVLNVGTQQSSRRARTPSPVLTQSARRGGVNSSRLLESPELGRRASIPKSASVPLNLRDKDNNKSSALVVLAPAANHQSDSSSSSSPAQGILKRSSSFFEGRSFCSLLRRKAGRASSPELRKVGGGGSSCSPRKCVSFSSDTSFAEERSRPAGERFKKTAVHEAKVYRKGVLQAINCCADRNGCEEQQQPQPGHPAATNLPLSWEESLGGPKALLGAAQDGDDELVKRIVALANKAGLGNIDINALDASGRTAISYMAGNGSALMLEACLSFPGADANLPDNEANTPLHFAAQAGQTECLNILLQRCPGIEVDARNSLGFTPLMKAALQGRTKCAKILLFAGANPTLRDHGRGLRAEQWARFCGRYVCAEVIERFARHRLLEKTTSCRWGSEPELAAQVLQGKLMPIPTMPVQPPPTGLKSKIRRVFRTSSNTTDKSFSLVSQLTSAALCASSPVLPKPGDVSPVVKSLLRPLSVPQLRITLVAPQDIIECSPDKIENSMVKPPRTKKKSK